MESTKIFLFPKTDLFPVRAVIDPGSTHSFIMVDVCEQFQSTIQPLKSKSCLAIGEKFPVFGVCSALVSIKNFFIIVFLSL